MNQSRPWAPGEIERLFKLRPHFRCARQLVPYFKGRTAAAIANRLAVLGIPYSTAQEKWTQEDKELLDLYWNKKRLSASRCAKLLGCSRSAVIGKVHRMGLASRPSPIKRRQAVLVALDDRKQCAWLDGHSGDWKPCSAPAEDGKPYCTQHCQRAYRGFSLQTGKPNQMDTFSGKRRKTAGGRV